MENQGPVFFQPSQKAVNAKETSARGSVWAKIKADFEACPVGMSFKVDSDVNEGTLRNAVSRRAKAMQRKYVVVNHGNGYEVSRRA